MTGNSGQVSRALRTEFPADPARHVVHEMICQAVCRPELGGLSRELPASVLRTRGRRRKPQRRTGECHASGPFHRRVRDVPRWVAPSVATAAWARSSAGTTSVARRRARLRYGQRTRAVQPAPSRQQDHPGFCGPAVISA
jgi:hypothetical protein